MLCLGTRLQLKDASTREKQLIADAEGARAAAKKAVAEARAAAPRVVAQVPFENGEACAVFAQFLLI